MMAHKLPTKLEDGALAPILINSGQISEGVRVKSTAPEIDPRKLTTAQKLAIQFWDLSDIEMGEFFEHLLEISGEHDLVSQMLWCRQACEEGNQKGLEGLQMVTSAAYRYILGDHLI